MEKQRSLLQKAYMVDSKFVKGTYLRVLIDDSGMVFMPTVGWISVRGKEWFRLIKLPGFVESTVVDWFDGWWETNWSKPDWSWCYMFGGNWRSIERSAS